MHQTDPQRPLKIPVEILRLRLRSHCLHKLRMFYGHTLGLLQMDATESPDALVLRTGETRIDFFPASPGTEPYYHFAFNIPENKLNAAITWLEGKVELLPNPETGQVVFDFGDWNAHSIYFLDPAGNIVEFIARHDLPNAGVGPFVAADLLAISEIGVPTTHVKETAHDLRQRLGVPTYIGATPRFTPLGDPRGLLIVTDEERPWMPTREKPAAAFPATITLRADRADEFFLDHSPVRFELAA